jgi:hypothetical protein
MLRRSTATYGKRRSRPIGWEGFGGLQRRISFGLESKGKKEVKKMPNHKTLQIKVKGTAQTLKSIREAINDLKKYEAYLQKGKDIEIEFVIEKKK